MNKVALKAALRQNGKKAAKDIRRSGNVPGVFYMNGKEPISIAVNPADMKSLIYTKEAKLIDLEIEGTQGTQSCFIKEMKFCPITEKLIHFDLLGLDGSKKVVFTVPVAVTGSSVGVRQGGILQQNLHKVKVKCLPEDLPSQLVVDISKLGVGDAIQIADLANEKYDFVLPKTTSVVQVAKSRLSAANTPQEQAAAAAI